MASQCPKQARKRDDRRSASSDAPKRESPHSVRIVAGIEVHDTTHPSHFLQHQHRLDPIRKRVPGDLYRHGLSHRTVRLCLHELALELSRDLLCKHAHARVVMPNKRDIHACWPTRVRSDADVLSTHARLELGQERRNARLRLPVVTWVGMRTQKSLMDIRGEDLKAQWAHAGRRERQVRRKAGE